MLQPHFDFMPGIEYSCVGAVSRFMACDEPLADKGTNHGFPVDAERLALAKTVGNQSEFFQREVRPEFRVKHDRCFLFFIHGSRFYR